jgi:ABC-2 type transport system permease protein
MTAMPNIIPPVHPDRLAIYVWKLLRLRWILFISSFRRSKTRQKVGSAVLVFMMLGLMVGAFIVSWLLLGFLNSPKLTRILGDSTPFLEAVPTMVLFAAFGGILITSFGVLLQALYLANDMEFLLSAPVPIRAVFIAKMLQAVLPNLGLTLLFGLPVLFGLGVSQHYIWVYFPAVILMLVSLALTAAALASLMVMGIVRIFPARRVAEVLAFIGAILSFVCGQSGQVFRFQANNDQTVGVFNSLSKINAPWFPLAWFGNSLVDLGLGNWITGVGGFLFVTSLAGIIVAFSLTTAERLYYTGWATAQISVRKKKKQPSSPKRNAVKNPVFGWIEQLIPAPVRAIAVKDFLVLSRDLRNLSQLITPLIFGVLYTFILLRDSGEAATSKSGAQINVLITYGNTGIALFVGWMLLMRLALIAFSQEGKNYWLLKVAPLNPQRLLTAKFLVAFLPSTGLGWTFLLVTGLLRHSNLFITVYGLIVITLSFAGMSGVLLAFGVNGANLEWTDPRQMIRGNSGCFGSLAGMLYIVLSAGLFYGPLVIGQALDLPTFAGGIAGLLLGGVFSLACAYIPLQLVFHRVEHLGEG